LSEPGNGKVKAYGTGDDTAATAAITASAPLASKEKSTEKKESLAT
jgi:hypothetical protein